MRTIRIASVALVAGGSLLAPLVAVPNAAASFPGTKNGLIAYVVKGNAAGAHGDIWTTTKNGATRHNLTKSTADDEQPSWSPNGKLIVWSRNGDIWKMRADGTHKTRLTSTPNIDDRGPSFSPGGGKIVWTREDAGGGTLNTMKVDGTGRFDTGVYGEEPQWSLDGQWIAFSRVEGGYTSIFEIRPNGFGITLLRERFQDGAIEMDWSPDLKRLAFTNVVTDQDQPDGAIVDLDVETDGIDGSNPQGAQQRDGIFERQPAFAPADPTLLVYVQTKTPTAGPSSLRLSPDQGAIDPGTKIFGSKKLIADPSWQPVP